MAGTIVASNAFLLDRANAARATLNSGHALALFTNQVPLTPALVLADFHEATFGSYSRLNLNGLFHVPKKIQDGEYATKTSSHTFISSGARLEKIRGWFVVSASGHVKLSNLLPVPQTMGDGNTLQISLTLEDFAASML
jgi:hypothetical protein